MWFSISHPQFRPQLQAEILWSLSLQFLTSLVELPTEPISDLFHNSNLHLPQPSPLPLLFHSTYYFFLNQFLSGLLSFISPNSSIFPHLPYPFNQLVLYVWHMSEHQRENTSNTLWFYEGYIKSFTYLQREWTRDVNMFMTAWWSHRSTAASLELVSSNWQ